MVRSRRPPVSVGSLGDPVDDSDPWLPNLILLSDHGGSWRDYIDAVHAAFQRDFVTSRPLFLGYPVGYRRDPIYDGKEAGFWHCTSEGQNEDDRTPDFRRCERIGWVRAIIENANAPGIDMWSKRHSGETRTLIWYREEFLIVLALRSNRTTRSEYYQLITAYCTMEVHRRRKLRRERDECRRGKG